MDFVGDYLTKKRLAEQLRGRQQAMLNADYDTGPIVTQGQGAAPTQVQANPWGNLAKLGSAYFAGKAGQNAESAETEAQAARMQALQGIMQSGQQPQAPNVPPGGDVGPVQPGQAPMTPAGQPGAGGGPGQPGALGTGMPKMTPEVLMQLSQLGLPDQVLRKLVPDDPALGAITQAASTPQGIAALVQMGVWTPEQGQAATQALKDSQAQAQAAELEEYESKKKLDAKYREPTYRAPREQTAFDLWKQQNPNGKVEDWLALNSSGKGSGGKGANKAADAAAATANMRNLLGEMKATAQNKDISSPGNQLGALMSQYDSPIMKVAGSKLMNASGVKMRSLQLDAALTEASKLTPVSNTDFKALMSRYDAAISNPQEFVKFVDDYDKFLSKYGEQPQQANEYAPNNVNNQGLYNDGKRPNTHKSSTGIEFEVE